MAKQVIGIAGNERSGLESLDIHVSYTPSGYVRGVQLADGIPYIIPIGDPENTQQYIASIDKLILAGGQNISPEFYHEDLQVASDDYNRSRDVFEIALVNEALRQKKPIFAVCRGMQLYNVIRGGSLNQEIPNHWLEDSTHDVVLDEGTPLYDIYGKRNWINSFHRQSVKKLGTGLKTIAKDPRDGTIEAIVDQNYPHFLGVQWHPDHLIQERKESIDVFDYVVNHL
ncbi:gamma-glutamyl-gamma-aminobutyrate hydrolase family protein [Streptococcus sp. DD12]|uniref:gamma-glutamyl-gamma-aminobutyrate hydrolase family protein n=1 Tax=Streptococcus sp. DD12 TaxID=1777880 RepID=UPI0007963454|nr:gamma-glutamyl-gamma-aminobutyrate hydrolase family protein [Streptococcus sp. DD12]KXT76576.1 Glutamine amidotransferase, class I [Streptococcus sp. DD12]